MQEAVGLLQEVLQTRCASWFSQLIVLPERLLVFVATMESGHVVRS